MSGRLILAVVGVIALLALLVRPVVTAFSPAPTGVRVVLWHSQRGAEKDTLEALLREFNREHEGKVYVEPLAVPDGSFKDKVLRTVPRGAGPDVFLRPHNELGEYLQESVVREVGSLPVAEAAYLPGLIDGVSSGGRRYGIPLTYKSLLVFYNTTLLPSGPPAGLDGVRALGKTLPKGTFPLAYEANLFFFNAPFFLAYGGKIFDGPEERFAIFDDPRSFRLPGELRREGTLPPEPSYNEAIRLFEAGQAAMILCGPWYVPSGPIAEKRAWDVAPIFSTNDQAGGSFVTVESAFITQSSKHVAEAEQVARFLAGPRGQAARYLSLSLPPVTAAAYDDLPALGAPSQALAPKLVSVQRTSLEAGLVTPSSTRMGAVWRPGDDVLRASVAGRDVDEAIEAAKYGLSRVSGKRAEPAGSRVYGILLAALLLLGTMLVVRRVRADTASPVAARARLTGWWGAAALPYLGPGVLASALLVLAPVVTGAGMSLFEYESGKFVFVGTQNFREILFPPLERAFEARSFYFALGVTVLWTILNVILHVSIGVAVALLLRPSYLRFRTAYRLVLILPWAIPNYITALMWKGMFNAQVGAINALLSPFGFEGKAWFDEFGTAFFANLVTNTWLGFPFMMVVTLGALSSIPRELEEASILDGASRWQRLVHIVLPHVRPALLPAVILGSVWTFNMFNVVYLVSGGEPGSQTDILVSEAYRWAFERGQRYGYAAAYSVLIFAFLLLYGRLTRRLDPEAA
ncbi:MAG: extracellular solute-binding protein [Polyangiaceae bacterium]|nr:extracellular solute-binding protein [Polyangiaceae bacterium]